MGTAGAALVSASGLSVAGTPTYLRKPIPKTGEKIPPIGMGTWLPFNIGQRRDLLDARENVLRAFFAHGGGMIDSSPMYANSEETIGRLLRRLKRPKSAFLATKIWSPVKSHGPDQLQNSRKLWGLPKNKPLDLVHVHNLLAIDHHLPLLVEEKKQGRVRYIGMTTSHGRRHEKMAKLLQTEPVDFVQMSYNILDRCAEKYLLPMAQDNGVAVVINRPFRTGLLFDHLAGHTVPSWAKEFGINTWAQFMLKFIISHPAVTCAIPATTRVDHMNENMMTGLGHMPDAKMRSKMINYVENL